MTRLIASIVCLILNFAAVAILGYLRYLLSLDRGYSIGTGIWGAAALLLLLVSALVFYLTEQGTFIRIIWFLSAACVLVLLFFS
jgi:hypothetical protein